MSTDYHKEFIDEWTKETTDRTGVTVPMAKKIAKEKWGRLPHVVYEMCVKQWEEVAPYPFGKVTRRVWLTNSGGYFHLKIL